jgi:hypothetical protein
VSVDPAIFEGLLTVAFGQAYVASDLKDFEPEVNAYFFGQRNGMLGAAKDGMLYLITGKTDGEVHLSVHVAEQRPLLDDSWEECVEASFSPATPLVRLFDWDRAVVCEIPLPEHNYRVRYTARGMDAGHAGTQTDAYGLWFWPAPAAPDAIVRQTSARAAYWHGEVARINEIL